MSVEAEAARRCVVVGANGTHAVEAAADRALTVGRARTAARALALTAAARGVLIDAAAVSNPFTMAAQHVGLGGAQPRRKRNVHGDERMASVTWTVRRQEESVRCRPRQPPPAFG
jgi:hypothetical protein